MLKYSPKRFWKMLNPTHTQNADVPVAALIEYNKKIFWKADITEDVYAPINNKEENYI
jgi:hypothetical protein